MLDQSVTPNSILQVCAGLWAAGALKSGVDLKLFDALAAGPQDISTLSHALGAAPQSLHIVLEALVALGLVARQEQGYVLTPESRAFLVSSQPTYLGALVAESAIGAAVFDVCLPVRMMPCFWATSSTIMPRRPVATSCASVCESWRRAGASSSSSLSPNPASLKACFHGCLAS
jgi:methyltransferase family protein